jgi:DNA adenine methylase
MATTDSPLRYPGGKSSLYDLTREIIHLNGLVHHDYAEPFAGGCGLALALLYGGLAGEIHVNDIDPGVWSFWNAVLNKTDQLVELIEKTPVTLPEWEKQRGILKTEGAGLVLGFATFFLNRTNRSGIIKKAGAIGGLKQEGRYLIDCRFNKPELIRRIRRMAKYKERIHLTNLDALDFLGNRRGAIPESAFFCIDPPYYGKGASLYTSFYRPDDHVTLGRAVRSLKSPWMVTYDNSPEIAAIYKSQKRFTFSINYSANVKRVGTELLIASKKLKIPAKWEGLALAPA